MALSVYLPALSSNTLVPSRLGFLVLVLRSSTCCLNCPSSVSQLRVNSTKSFPSVSSDGDIIVRHRKSRASQYLGSVFYLRRAAFRAARAMLTPVFAINKGGMRAPGHGAYKKDHLDCVRNNLIGCDLSSGCD